MPITTIDSLGANREIAVTNSVFTTLFSGNPTMTGGSNWFDTGSNYFGCEIAASHRLANNTTYFQVQGRLPTALNGGAANPTVWILMVTHPSGSPTPGNTITIVSGWRFRLPNGANGDLFTVNFADALESFGPDKTAATGNFYIGWMHTTLTGRGSLTGAYWVDTTEGTAGFGQGQANGTIYYQINPGPAQPRTITPANGPVARGLHWRLIPRVDYNITGVETLTANNLRATASLRVDNKLAGVYELINHTTWRTNTSAVNIAFQPQLYSHYKVFWNIRHGPSWFQTYLRFLDATNNVITDSSYANTGYWHPPGSANSPTFNSTYFSTTNSFIWMAGNGNEWNSSGEATIFTGDDFVDGLGVNRAATTGNRHPTVRGKSQLYGSVGGSDTARNYTEEFGAIYYGTTAVAGFQIFGSGGASGLGSVWVYGARYE
jgi:hypothetical protein